MAVLEKAKIYGVDKVGSSDPSALVRTDSAVGLNVTVGASEIHSDFNRCYPWSDMEEVVDEYGNVFIKIPKFYAKITKNADGTYKHQISGARHDGFTTLFVDGKGNEIDYVLVGKYEGSGAADRIYSKAGQTVLVNLTIVQYRTGCMANGEGYQQYDFLIDLIIKELWLIEMKTTDCQSIMKGNTENDAAVDTGRTDAVAAPSGSEVSNTDAVHACKYRGIENPFGNVYKWVDGISFNGTKVYVCFDPTAYKSEDYNPPYFYQGERFGDMGYVTKVEPLGKHPLIQYITDASGDGSTYYCDFAPPPYGTVLYAGGYWDDNDYAGLWSWDVDYGASVADSSIGGRLCYKPL